MTSRNGVLVLAVTAYLGLLLAPLGISFFSSQAGHLLPRPVADDIASGLAMVGFAAIGVEFFLLGRFRPLSTLLGSDLLMQSHQLMARTLAIFLLVHPFIYSLWGEPARTSDPGFAQALMIGGPSLLTGVLAWLALIVLIISAIRHSKPGVDYDRWRRMHGILALVVVALGLHHTLSAGRYAKLAGVAGFWWALCGLGVLSLAWVYGVRPFLQKRRPYEVVSVTPQAHKTYALVLAPKGHRGLCFRPGQFVWLKLGSIAPTHDHPFSIASSPGESRTLSLLIKTVGDFTARIPSLDAKTPAYLDGPHGHFQIPASAPAVVMIAGGIGVAPFLSLLADCAGKNDSRPIRLIYGNRLPEQAVDVHRICGTENLGDFLRLDVLGETGRASGVLRDSPSGVTSRISADGLSGALSGQLDFVTLETILARPEIGPLKGEAIFMICGPSEMIDSVEESLVRLGIPLSRIISEKFQYDMGSRSPRTQRTRALWMATSFTLLTAIVVTALR